MEQMDTDPPLPPNFKPCGVEEEDLNDHNDVASNTKETNPENLRTCVNACRIGDSSSVNCLCGEKAVHVPEPPCTVTKNTNVVTSTIASGIQNENSSSKIIKNKHFKPVRNFNPASRLSMYFSQDVQDDLGLLQATVFIEDAAKYKDINHRIDGDTLRIYRTFNSAPVSIFRTCVLTVLHLLAFVEYPSSLTWTSDVRYRGVPYELPCGVTESIEFLCLLLLLIDVLFQVKFLGKSAFVKKNWLLASVFVLAISLCDWSAAIGLQCKEPYRIRRLLRPFFILSYSSLMKKTVRCVKRTLPEVASVLLLLALHIFVFTLMGMLIFPKHSTLPNTTVIHPGQEASPLDLNITTPATIQNSTSSDVEPEGRQYFNSVIESIMNLLVLLTTANNPDIMMPAYQENRLYAVYFVIFLLIGNYCFMNMFLAVIYNQFRGYFKTSMQSSLLRQRVGVRAAYEILQKIEKKQMHYRLSNEENRSQSDGCGVRIETVRLLLVGASLPRKTKRAIYRDLDYKEKNDTEYLMARDFQSCFDALNKDNWQRENQKPEIRWFTNRYLRLVQRVVVHKFYNYFGNLIAFVNVLLISIELAAEHDKSLRLTKSILNIVNFIFIVYYVLEQSMKFVALGWKRYVYLKWNLFDGCITLALVVAEIFSVYEYGFPLKQLHKVDTDKTAWNAVRIINILIMVRLFRIIPHIKAMSIVANTLVDLIKNLKAFAGILVVIYYSFAIFGMQLFHNKITVDKKFISQTELLYECGSYQQLEYWANNFDDFAAALIVLWDIMVVNNWSVFLKVFKEKTSRWSYLYFIVWWLVSVIIVLQLFTALIIENFIMKWDHSSSPDRQDQTDNENSIMSRGHSNSVPYMTLHDMFRANLEEPSERQVLGEIANHRYLNLDFVTPEFERSLTIN